jgi:hypothetical protein
MHNLIDEASISTHFVTDLSSAQPAASDVFIFVQPGTPIYRKTTYSTLLLSQTNLIVSQTEVDTPQTNDFMLIFQSSSGNFGKTPLQALFTNNLVIGSTPDYTNLPYGGFSYPYWSNGVPNHIEHSNLFAGWWQWEPFSTNVGSTSPVTNPPIASLMDPASTTNANMFMAWDAIHQTNKFLTWAGLLTNAPAVNSTNIGSGDWVPVFSTKTNAFAPNATNVVGKFHPPQRFVSGLYPVPVSSTVITNIAHGLDGTPQSVRWVLVETNTAGDAASKYDPGDEIPIDQVLQNAAGVGNTFVWGANASNVFLANSFSAWALYSKTNSGTATGPTSRQNFAVKAYATYFP